MRGGLLYQKRRSKGYTQVDVAKRANISGAFYCMIEAGKRRPSPEVAHRIAKALGFSDEWYRLLEEKEADVP